MPFHWTEEQERALQRRNAKRPWSKRMVAVVERLLKTEQHTFSFAPGHDFQTCISLQNRGDVIGVIYGEAPREWITATLTAQGLARAQAALAPKPPTLVPAKWPFPHSSRGWHLPEPAHTGRKRAV